jgi:hypothetical protein
MAAALVMAALYLLQKNIVVPPICRAKPERLF